MNALNGLGDADGAADADARRRLVADGDRVLAAGLAAVVAVTVVATVAAAPVVVRMRPVTVVRYVMLSPVVAARVMRV